MSDALAVGGLVVLAVEVPVAVLAKEVLGVVLAEEVLGVVLAEEVLVKVLPWLDRHDCGRRVLLCGDQAPMLLVSLQESVAKCNYVN